MTTAVNTAPPVLKPTIPQLRWLVGNPNVYAVQKEDGSWYPVDKPLTPAVLKDHLAGKITVGTYVLNGDKARTLVFDSDADSGAYTEVDRIVAALAELGIPSRSVAREFSGNKGYHVWVVLSQYVPAIDLRRLGRYVLGLAGVECEVFPKQNQAVKYGNLVKLPGGIHQVSKKANNFIDHVPQPMGLSVFENVLKDLPELATMKVGGEAPPATECLDNIMSGVSEGGRNEALFHLAALLRYRGIPDEWVAKMINEAAENCDPPVDQDEVDQLLDSSKNSGPKCSTLPDNLRCADCPVLRNKGLFAKPNQLRHGAEQELVVVQIGKRRAGGVVELEHPDLDVGLVRLKDK